MVMRACASCVFFDECRARELLLDWNLCCNKQLLDGDVEAAGGMSRQWGPLPGQAGALGQTAGGPTAGVQAPAAPHHNTRSTSNTQSGSPVRGGTCSVPLQAKVPEMETKLAEMRALLPASVHEQLVAGGEPGLDTEITLTRWLRARKVRREVFLLLSCCCW
jgi:hypothetical protein